MKGASPHSLAPVDALIFCSIRTDETADGRIHELVRITARLYAVKAERDRLIRDLRSDGWPLRTLAAWAALSHTSIRRIADQKEEA